MQEAAAVSRTILKPRIFSLGNWRNGNVATGNLYEERWQESPPIRKIWLPAVGVAYTDWFETSQSASAPLSLNFTLKPGLTLRPGDRFEVFAASLLAGWPGDVGLYFCKSLCHSTGFGAHQGRVRMPPKSGFSPSFCFLGMSILWGPIPHLKVGHSYLKTHG